VSQFNKLSVLDLNRVVVHGSERIVGSLKNHT